jgi:hypothetical protein
MGSKCLQCCAELTGIKRMYCSATCKQRYWLANNRCRGRAKVRRFREKPYGKYVDHRAGAVQRGIPFLLTFDEWWDIWQKSGKWHLRGSGQYMMCRYGDDGPYAVGNVYIGTATDNINDRYGNASARRKSA